MSGQHVNVLNEAKQWMAQAHHIPLTFNSASQSFISK